MSLKIKVGSQFQDAKMSSNTVIMGAGMTNMEISMIQMASQQMIPIKSGRKNPEVH